MSRRRVMSTEHVEPDLPITPMLDMSFQLLSFFIMTFHPAPTEGQIRMSLPPPEQGGAAKIPDITDPKPIKYIVTVTATEGEGGGAIASITLREDGAADDVGKKLGADAQVLLKELKAVPKGAPGAPPPKLTIQMAENLLHGYVVQLMDAGVLAGFDDISPVPLSRREG